ncbi:MAG: protealysin inhibitor emfourin [Acidobacteriota bacterium]
MRIRYKRSGGIANVVTRIEFDSSELPQNLQLLLQTLRPLPPSEPLHSDEFFHELQLEDGRTIRCTDSHCPPPLLNFFEFLTQRHRDTEE